LIRAEAYVPIANKSRLQIGRIALQGNFMLELDTAVVKDWRVQAVVIKLRADS
jgi:hypothetical protein